MSCYVCKKSILLDINRKIYIDNLEVYVHWDCRESLRVYESAGCDRCCHNKMHVCKKCLKVVFWACDCSPVDKFFKDGICINCLSDHYETIMMDPKRLFDTALGKGSYEMFLSMRK